MNFGFLEPIVLAGLEGDPIDFGRVNEIEMKRVMAAIKRAEIPDGICCESRWRDVFEG